MAAPEADTHEAILQAASRILAALILNGRLTNGNRASLARMAVEMATQLSREAERALAVPSGDAIGDDVLDLLE
jgi:hypothetical protein